MSDTPRTDAEAFWPHDSQYKVCDAVFARQLERELNSANADVERLTKANLQLREGCEELKQRIKRLEEAGDALEYASVILEAGEDPNGFEKLLIAQRDWHRAKEAKL